MELTDKGGKLNTKDIALNGKLVTMRDGTLIAENDFQELVNMRYTDNNIRGIAGMTKINSSAPSEVKHRTGIQYDKNNPREKHILVQSYNSDLNKSVIQEIISEPPAVGNFTSFYTVANSWGSGHTYSEGDIVFPTVYNGMYAECIIGGTSDSTEPTWVTTELSRVEDNTVIWIMRIGNLLGKFSRTPDGGLAYANGKKSLIWGGNEYRVGRFINYDPNNTFFYDFTSRVTNNRSTSGDTAVLKPSSGGLDANTSLALHLDNNLTDSSANGFTVTGNAPVLYSNTYKKFGTHSFWGNNRNKYLTVADNTKFDFSGGNCTVEGWFYYGIVTANQVIYSQGTSNNPNPKQEYMKMYFSTTEAAVWEIYSGGTLVFTLRTADSIISNVSDFFHVAFSENGDDYMIFINGIMKAHSTSPIRMGNYTGNVYISGESDYLASPTITGSITDFLDEIIISKTAKYTENFSLQTAEFGIDSKTYAYAGSTLPIDGLKFYINNPNTATCATPTVEYWDGNTSVWVSVGSITDTTKVSNVTMAQTGSLIWSTTNDIASLKMINNILLYWYRITWNSIDDTTSVYYITTNTSIQTAKDIWDGASQPVLGCQKYTVSAGYEDNVTNVLKQDSTSLLVSAGTFDYAPETYLNMNSFATTSYVYFGFSQRSTGLYFYITFDKVNSNVVTPVIEYWNGSAWAPVTGLDDQTSTSGKSFSKTGFIMWSPVNENLEFTTHVSNNTELFYYRLSFSGALSASVHLDYVASIPTPQDLKDYNFPIMWKNRLFYCGNKSKDKNKIIGSSSNTLCVFNGQDYVERYLGTNEEINSGATLFSRYGTQISENLILTKLNEVWMLDGDSPETITAYRISKKYGCNAPHTMQVCDLGFEIAPGVNKAVVIWQSNTGIVMFDNGSIISISQDIDDIFQRMYDTSYSTRINMDYSDISSSFYDPINKEYHWLYAEGSSTIINSEMVFDVVKKKWYKVSRGTKYLQCGFNIIDLKGNYYTYGTIDTGYVERLEYGHSMDGTSYDLYFRTGDKLLSKSMIVETQVRNTKLIGKSKTSGNSVNLYHYKDGETSSTQLMTSVNQNVTTSRLYEGTNSSNLTGSFHSFKVSTTSNNDYVPFEPLALAVLYKVIRYDTYKE
jgi:hypothetical protein